MNIINLVTRHLNLSIFVLSHEPLCLHVIHYTKLTPSISLVYSHNYSTVYS